MPDLERLQIITELIRLFKTAILLDEEAEKTGNEVLQIVQQSGDTIVADLVLNAYMKRSDREVAVSHLDEATTYLHGKIDALS